MDSQSALSLTISCWVNNVSATIPGIREIWLIGSRANKTERVDSDYDFLVLADEKFLSAIRKRYDLHRADVDFLVSTDGVNFQSAWGSKKTIVLSKIGWQLISETTAVYEGQKWIADEYDPDEASPYDTKSLGQFQCIRCIGVRLTTLAAPVCTNGKYS